MAFFRRRIRRTFRRRRPVVRRRTTYKRSTFRRYRPMRRYNTQYMTIKRRIQFTGNNGDENAYPYDDFGTLSTTSDNNYIGTGYFFTFNQIPNYLEYANLYEQYRITGVKVFVQYMSSTEYFGSVLVGGDQALNGCEFMIWSDTDSSDAPASTSTGWKNAFESGRFKLRRFPNVRKNTMSLYIKPNILLDAYAGGSDAFAMAKRSPWLKTGNPDTRHYGFKVMLNVDPTTAPIEHRFRIFCTYYCQFKHAKGETNT